MGEQVSGREGIDSDYGLAPSEGRRGIDRLDIGYGNGRDDDRSDMLDGSGNE